ncbi:MAG: hypothetical protein AAGA48_32460 [Myxococcota bacterium]
MLQADLDCPVIAQSEPIVGQQGPPDVAAEALEGLAVASGDRHTRVQVEPALPRASVRQRARMPWARRRPARWDVVDVVP